MIYALLSRSFVATIYALLLGLKNSYRQLIRFLDLWGEIIESTIKTKVWSFVYAPGATHPEREREGGCEDLTSLCI